MLEKPTPRHVEKRRATRVEARVQHLARIRVFQEDERCRFPWGASMDHPCGGPDELMHMGSRTKAKTVNRPPDFRHDPLYLMMGCREHHQGTYSYDGSLGGKGFAVEPLTDKLYRGPCRFVDVETGDLLGIN